VRKRAIVIIISFISAFVLMSGGYGYWQKPLIITGKIKVLEPPLPPISVVVPLNPVVLDPNQPVILTPEVPNNPEESVGAVPNEQSVEGEENLNDSVTVEKEPVIEEETPSDSEDTDSASIDQAINIQEENLESIVNLEQEQAVSEAAKGENTEAISIPKAENDETNEEESIDSKPEMVDEDGKNIIEQNGE
jgi:hypothetical protein